jgi:hypothetical protein
LELRKPRKGAFILGSLFGYYSALAYINTSFAIILPFYLNFAMARKMFLMW